MQIYLADFLLCITVYLSNQGFTPHQIFLHGALRMFKKNVLLKASYCLICWNDLHPDVVGPPSLEAFKRNWMVICLEWQASLTLHFLAVNKTHLFLSKQLSHALVERYRHSKHFFLPGRMFCCEVSSTDLSPQAPEHCIPHSFNFLSGFTSPTIFISTISRINSLDRHFGGTINCSSGRTLNQFYSPFPEPHLKDQM